MSLHWLQGPEKSYEITDPIEEYKGHVVKYNKLCRIISLLRQLAPGEVSIQFTSPSLKKFSKESRYFIRAIEKGTFDLLNITGCDNEVLLARLKFPKLGAVAFADVEQKTEKEVDSELELIKAFMRQEVVQPDPDSGLPMIKFPRVHLPMPDIRIFDPKHPGNLLPYEARKFMLGQNEHSFLVPKTPTIESQPIAGREVADQVIEEVSFIDPTKRISEVDVILECISMDFPNTLFVEVDGGWPDVHSLGIILHQDGGRFGNGLEPLLHRKLTELGMDFDGTVFYGLTGDSIEQFSIVRSRL